MRLLIAFIFSIGGTVLYAQSTEYSYEFHEKDAILKRGGETVFIPSFSKPIGVQTITLDGIDYKVEVRKTKAGKIEIITGKDGNKLATVFLGSVKHNTILLPSGEEYIFAEDKGSVTYSRGKSEYIKASNSKNLQTLSITSSENNATPTPHVVKLVALERGVDKVRVKKMPTFLPVMIVSSFVAVIGVLSSGSDSK